MIWTILLLFLCGIALILAEFFLPGAICGILGAVLVIASCAFGVYYFPDLWFLVIAAEGLAVVVTVVAGLYIMPHTRLGRAMILDDTQQAEAGWVSDVDREDLLGKEGVVTTQLRPAGTIEIQGERVSAVANGSFIEKGATVRVIEVHGNRVVVEETAAG
jgi:membrane-bound serine protease (ClpP class)